MGSRKALTSFEQGEIAAYILEKKSIQFISKKIGRSRTAIVNFIKKDDKYNKSSQSDHPKLLSPRKKKIIVKMARNKMITAGNIKACLDLNVSKTTILRVLKKQWKFKISKNAKKTRFEQYSQI